MIEAVLVLDAAVTAVAVAAPAPVPVLVHVARPWPVAAFAFAAVAGSAFDAIVPDSCHCHLDVDPRHCLHLQPLKEEQDVQDAQAKKKAAAHCMQLLERY